MVSNLKLNDQRNVLIYEQYKELAYMEWRWFVRLLTALLNNYVYNLTEVM
jgi:hypothetical protein